MEGGRWREGGREMEGGREREGREREGGREGRHEDGTCPSIEREQHKLLPSSCALLTTTGCRYWHLSTEFTHLACPDFSLFGLWIAGTAPTPNIFFCV